MWILDRPCGGRSLALVICHKQKKCDSLSLVSWLTLNAQCRTNPKSPSEKPYRSLSSEPSWRVVSNNHILSVTGARDVLTRMAAAGRTWV